MQSLFFCFIQKSPVYSRKLISLERLDQPKVKLQAQNRLKLFGGQIELKLKTTYIVLFVCFILFLCFSLIVHMNTFSICTDN